MDIVSTMSSVSTTFELLQQKHPILILTAELIIGSNQMSAYKDIESPDSNVWSLSGRTDTQRIYFSFRKFQTESRQGTKSRQTNSGLTDIGKIWTGTRENVSEDPDKTRQGQDMDSTVHRSRDSRAPSSQNIFWKQGVLVNYRMLLWAFFNSVQGWRRHFLTNLLRKKSFSAKSTTGMTINSQ